MKPKTLLALKLAAGLDLSASACDDLHRMQRFALEALAEETSTTPVSPPPVPIGPTVTRDGRKARVICIDAVGQGNNDPVVALVSINENQETVRYFRTDGSISGNREGAKSDWDLVGHLPPEPPKPREFWICTGGPQGESPRAYTVKQENLLSDVEQIHVIEVLP